MKTAEVLRVKAAVRERDSYCCTKCGMSVQCHYSLYGKNLQVHRIDPGSEYALNGCVTLCYPCHAKEPKRKGMRQLERWLRHRAWLQSIGEDVSHLGPMPPVPPFCVIVETDSPSRRRPPSPED